ncbi:pupal cuticle protein 20 [Tribolium castaneum]|uniref:Endocuticle structural glycoprotein SgAbd-2-like Protein n=1 Tax=Tribolium castaneum TaxID=7070 RepID=D6WFI3_TRICA|nr:PREDICTED: pupal cuticle protein 20 [Tribolium castaneum]EFA00926.1 Endocuticle structural glycoprotein SgAbd-2-like Protein [Tribolium castaneum]|eukprot:XP_968593.1 PREDICTED: pupal cuticle protein 20 [Tribolium castaneum]
MRRVLLISALCGLAACAGPNQYLPPNRGGSFGGQSNRFSSPSSFSGGGSSGGFSSPSSFSGGGGGGFSSPSQQVPILRLDNNNEGDGNYQYAYETGNGIAAQERGQLRGDWVAADGSFSFTSPEGQQFSITYTADENGFHPQGAHLPTPPPIPEAILKSIQQNLAEEARGGYQDDGQYNGGHGSSGGSGGHGGAGSFGSGSRGSGGFGGSAGSDGYRY